LRVFAVLSCLVISLAAASTAQARWYLAPVKVEKIKSIKWRIKAYEKNIHVGKSMLRFTKTHTELYTYKEWLRVRKDHKWMIRFSTNRIAELKWSMLPPHYSGWICIHGHEGSWYDDGDPYWGGLQMDRGFMKTYAPSFLLRKGWANRWTPLQQMWVAERAFSSGRGYYPWPNTARMCGLI
jgi:hypothetical protein